MQLSATPPEVEVEEDEAVEEETVTEEMEGMNESNGAANVYRVLHAGVATRK